MSCNLRQFYLAVRAHAHISNGCRTKQSRAIAYGAINDEHATVSPLPSSSSSSSSNQNYTKKPEQHSENISHRAIWITIWHVVNQMHTLRIDRKRKTNGDYYLLLRWLFGASFSFVCLFLWFFFTLFWACVWAFAFACSYSHSSLSFVYFVAFLIFNCDNGHWAMTSSIKFIGTNWKCSRAASWFGRFPSLNKWILCCIDCTQ